MFYFIVGATYFIFASVYITSYNQPFEVRKAFKMAIVILYFHGMPTEVSLAWHTNTIEFETDETI